MWAMNNPTTGKPMMDGVSAVADLLQEYDDAERMGGTHESETYYDLHPLALSEWLCSMEVAQNYFIGQNHGWTGEESYLELGCGTGVKLRVAERMGWRVEGVELWQPYAELAQRWAPVEVCDAWDFKRYGEFDLVFVYRLHRKSGREYELASYIASQMKPGALFFHAGGPDPKQLEHVGASIWRVGGGRTVVPRG